MIDVITANSRARELREYESKLSSAKTMLDQYQREILSCWQGRETVYYERALTDVRVRLNQLIRELEDLADDVTDTAKTIQNEQIAAARAKKAASEAKAKEEAEKLAKKSKQAEQALKKAQEKQAAEEKKAMEQARAEAERKAKERAAAEEKAKQETVEKLKKMAKDGVDGLSDWLSSWK